MNRIFLILILMFFGFSSQSQLLLNRSSQQIEEELIFNKAFVLSNNIKSIHAQYMVKKDWQGLSDYGNRFEYQFDELGNLIYKKEIQQIANKIETKEFSYIYNNDNNIIEEKTNRSGGYSIKEYKYDNNRIVEVINYAEGKEPDSAKKVEMNRQKFIWKQVNDSIVQKSVANNFGQPYLLITYYYDKQNKFLKKEDHHLLVTGEKEMITYFYNKFGWLKQANINGKEINYSYDEYGNVVEINHYGNGKTTKHLEYLYKPNGLLEAQLKTENESTAIHILKYSIEQFVN